MSTYEDKIKEGLLQPIKVQRPIEGVAADGRRNPAGNSALNPKPGTRLRAGQFPAPLNSGLRSEIVSAEKRLLKAA